MPTGQFQHRLSEINPENRTAVCAVCGPVRIRKRSSTKGFHWRCCVAARVWDGNRGANRHYRHKVGDVCERCGFVPEHECQLDVHHKPGTRAVKTLCANCHRLITQWHREKG